jgi:mannose-6-phosphate isomerase-like protein (cupin superfamily)
MQGLVVDPVQGEVAELGMIRFRLLAASADTNGAFGFAEFRGAEGPWTVPHVHREREESFYVLDGTFSFLLGEREVEAARGTFVLVPRGVRHIMRAGPGGGALLGMWAPAGLEEMFLELGRLPADSITDPAVRAEIGRRHDSVPA